MFRKCMTRGFLMVVGILVKTGMVRGKKSEETPEVKGAEYHPSFGSGQRCRWKW